MKTLGLFVDMFNPSELILSDLAWLQFSRLSKEKKETRVTPIKMFFAMHLSM